MTREEYEKLLEGARQIVASKENNGCTCANIKCPWHGKCFECVKIHRVRGHHVPECLQFIFKSHLERLASCIEMKLEDNRTWRRVK